MILNLVLIAVVLVFAGLLSKAIRRIDILTDERDSAVLNLKHEYQVGRNEVQRLTNKLIEVQNHATLIEKDAAERVEEFKKHPLIACMSDGQVSILAEMLAISLRQILESKKEYVN